MTKKLTEAAVAKLTPPKAGHRLIHDRVQAGLVLKLTSVGRRIWVLKAVYPSQRLQARRTLGVYPGLSLQDARTKARQWSDWIGAGIDPKDAEDAQRQKAVEQRKAAALKDANNFAAVAAAYIAERETWSDKNRRLKDDAREIRRELVSAWGDRPIASITPNDVKTLIGGIKKRSPYNAKAAWGHAVVIFRWATHMDLTSASPCASLDKKLLLKGAKLGPRQRVLDEEETAVLWRAAGRLGYPIGAFYRLLLLTGLRKTELAKAQWSELHPELRRLLREGAANKRAVEWGRVPDAIKLLTIPPERFKSDAVHLVPLSNTACAILETLPHFQNCDWLFTENGATPMNGFSKAKARLDARMLRSLKAIARKRGDDPKKAQLQPWVTHDLRRVVKTSLASLRIADHVSELVLGHARKGLQGTYDRHSYMAERRQALHDWAGRVAEITGSKPRALGHSAEVVPMRRSM
jgi:integrase